MGLAFLITGDQLQLLSERKVLHEHEYSTLLEADGVMRAARSAAERTRQGIDAEVQAARETARKEGLQAARTSHAQDLLAQAVGRMDDVTALRDIMARLVTQAVIGLVAEADPAKVLQSALSRVDALVRDEPYVSVRVAAPQADTLRTALQCLHERNPWTGRVIVQPDPALPEGTCVMQTASGTVDLSLDAQIAVFQQSMHAVLHGEEGLT